MYLIISVSDSLYLYPKFRPFFNKSVSPHFKKITSRIRDGSGYSFPSLSNIACCHNAFVARFAGEEAPHRSYPPKCFADHQPFIYSSLLIMLLDCYR